MLKQLEKLFGFRTTENTNISSYLNRMDVMGKLDSKKSNELTAVFIEKFIEMDKIVEKLETMNRVLMDEVDKLKEAGNKPVVVSQGEDETLSCDYPGCDFTTKHKLGLSGHKRSHENKKTE